MATNPLVKLTEQTSKISEDMSPAKAAYILSQILEKIGYDERQFSDTAEEVSPSEQEDAIKTLAEIIAEVNLGKSYEDSIITVLSLAEERAEEIDDKATSLLLVEDRETSPSTQPFFMDEVDTSSVFVRDMIVIEEVSTLTEQEKTFFRLEQQNIEDIHRYVIPLVLTRLMKEESAIESVDAEGLRIRIYESEKFTATLKVTPEDKQLLTLDRNILEENEEARALEATRESSQLRFEIIINNITQLEIEKIKAIAQKEAQKASQRNSQEGEIGD